MGRLAVTNAAARRVLGLRPDQEVSRNSAATNAALHAVLS